MAGETQSIAFDTPAREQAADTFGMWVFVGSEAMLFGAILLVFFLARISYEGAFAAASHHLSLTLGTLNTAVLITSSFAMALAHLTVAGAAEAILTAGVVTYLQRANIPLLRVNHPNVPVPGEAADRQPRRVRPITVALGAVAAAACALLAWRSARTTFGSLRGFVS